MSISNSATAALAASYYHTGASAPLGATGRTSTADQPQTITKTTAPVPAKEDTVHLSATAQANALYQQGRTISQIAYSLDVSSRVVEGYLAITPTTTTNPASAPPGSATSKNQASNNATFAATAGASGSATASNASTGAAPPPPRGNQQTPSSPPDTLANNNTTANAQVKSATY